MSAETVHFRTCPFCEATCGLAVTMRGDEVVSVRGDEDDVFSRGFICPKSQGIKQLHEDPDLIRTTVAEINASVARRSGRSISEECVTGYLLRSGAAAIGSHGIPEHAACFPNWLKRDLETGGINGFEPPAPGESTPPVQWKRTTARLEKGTLLRTHEIANAGPPIIDRVERGGRPPTWITTRASGRITIAITFATGS